MRTIQQLMNFAIININKPSGPTSFSVSDYVRKKLSELGVSKTSHFGTLDPKVTGVLPVALGRACKLTGFFLGHDKEYIGIMRIHKEMKIEEVQEIINKNFLGKIKQLPPRKSSVKRAEREREIISFELLEKNEQDILFKTKVQGGTYIRKLISDLGELIGGAHMLELRRVQAGIFNEKTSITLYELDKAVEEYKRGNKDKMKEILIPAEESIKEIFEFVQCKKDIMKKLLTGKPIFKEDLLKEPEEDMFAIFCEENFIGIYKKTKEDAIIARPEFVYN